jgi:lysophospholipase L1-like esterase
MKMAINTAARIQIDKVGFFLFILLACTVSLTLATIANSANITAFGDSITVGLGSATGGYPPKLASLLNGNGKPSSVASYGKSGEKTSEGVSRFDSVLAAFPANIILIMEGTNDVRGGLSVETSRYNLQAMITKAKAAGVTPVIATLTPSNRDGSTTLIPQVWNPMITALAGSNGINLSDQYGGILPAWGSANADGLHPNDYGYQIVADTWYGTIASMISSTGEAGSGGDGGGGGGGCFIATAAFGSAVEKHVVLLKEFRDSWLLTNAPGRHFVSAYYRLSPPVAYFIDRHDYLKPVVRVSLYPLIALSYILLKLSLPLQLALIGVITGFTLAGLIVGRRRHL